MTDYTLAEASNLALYTALGVLTLAMLAFAVHLAVQGSARAVPERTAVGAGAPGAAPPPPEPGPPPEDSRAGSRRWGVVGVQLTWLATFAVIAAVTLRGLSVHRAPLGNMYEFALVVAGFTLLLYSLWSLRRDVLWLGLFVVTPVLLLLGAALVAWYTEASQLLPSLNSIWLWIHVSVATLSVALFTIGCVLALLFLSRDRAERSGRPLPGWLRATPQASVLERLTYGVHIVSFPLWTFTVMAGAIWAEQAWGRYWGWDPKEVWSFVIWVVYAAYLHARATTGWSTRRATWLAVAGYACIIVNYAVVNVFFVGWHSYSGL